MKIKLLNRNTYSNDEFCCEVTRFLDNNNPNYFQGPFKNYLLYLSYLEDDKDLRTFAIRVPGRTVGAMKIDREGIIVSCIIDDDIKYYTEGINEFLKNQFVGSELEGYKLLENNNIEILDLIKKPEAFHVTSLDQISVNSIIDFINSHNRNYSINPSIEYFKYGDMDNIDHIILHYNGINIKIDIAIGCYILCVMEKIFVCSDSYLKEHTVNLSYDMIFMKRQIDLIRNSSIYGILGNSRDATPEELKSVSDYVSSISTKIEGCNFFDSDNGEPKNGESK